MRSRSLAVALAMVAALPLAACGGSEPSSAPAAGGGGGGAGGDASGDGDAAAEPGKPPMPKYDKSGIREDYGRLKEAKQAVAHAKKKDEKAAAEEALAKLSKELADKWSASPPPAQEAFYQALIMQEAERPADAMAAAKRYLELADKHSGAVNAASMTLLVIQCQVASGDLDAAEALVAKAAARDGAFEGKTDSLAAAVLEIAVAREKKGELEKAAGLYEKRMAIGTGDPEAAQLATDCWQRLGKPGEAVRVAKAATEGFPDDRTKKRMGQLLAACELVGKPAPGFGAAKHWKGSGGPVSNDALKGGVTLVFAWNMNMKPDRTKKLFENLNAVSNDFGDRGVNLVGISRLAKFDPAQGGTVPDMTEDQELDFYDSWERNYGTRCAYAVGGLDDDSLVDAWAAHLVPALIVVGKDGKVAYTRTGFDEDHFKPVRERIEKELAK